MDAQHFQLDNYNELASKYSKEEIWKINEKYLNIQTSSGREIYLSHNPEDYLGLREQEFSITPQDLSIYLENNDQVYAAVVDIPAYQILLP